MEGVAGIAVLLEGLQYSGWWRKQVFFGPLVDVV